MRCEPANSTIQKLGGLGVVSLALDKSHTTILRWRLPKERGGTGGVIPHWHHAVLQALGKRRGVELTLADFVPAEQTAAAG